jgi:hypothetical protein
MRARSFAAIIGVLSALAVLRTSPATAQPLRLSSVEVVTGHAGFVDDAWDHRVMAGGVARFALGPRFRLGPEVVYLAGRKGAHDLTVTGTGTVDLVNPAAQRRIVPFVVFGAGLIRQTSLVGGGPGTTGLFPYSTSEGTVSGGIGARIRLGRRLYVAPDIRLGWEPETRFTIALGWRS